MAWELKKIIILGADILELLLGRRYEHPIRMRLAFTALTDRFSRKTREEYLHYFIKFGGLKPDERVLDVGCGIGRMAIPLSQYLDGRGSYEGFDIVANWISWCKKKITPKYPNFRFTQVDVFNRVYNPNGKYKASEYRFPYQNESFDFVFLKSVFTHMLIRDMDNYFREIARVLKKGKRCLMTFFLLNKESVRLVNAGKSEMNFRYKGPRYRTIDMKVRERAIAYDEDFIRPLYRRYGLDITEPIRYGSWCGRKNFLRFQDTIMAIRE